MTEARFTLAWSGPALMLALLLGLTACAEPEAMDYREKYAIKVQLETVVVPAHFAANDAVAGDSAADLDALAVSYIDRGHGPVTLAIRAPGGRADPRSLAQARAVRARLVAAGVPGNAIRIVLGEEGRFDTVMLSYERYSVLVPICGDWSVESHFNPNNDVHPDFGCAMQHNFGLLVADPANLVAPPALASPDAANSNRVVEKYRAGLPTTATQSQLQTTGAAGIVGVGH
jgi:pilus assembly protein CpaD